MARISVKKNKTDFQLSREELGYSRERASELLEFISPERLERIENEKMDVTPIEVLKMAEVYKNPSLCNYYCSKKCQIGEKFVPEIEIKDLEKIILRMVASLNSMQKCKDRLIEITADGEIRDDEIKDIVVYDSPKNMGSVAAVPCSKKRFGRNFNLSQNKVKQKNHLILMNVLSLSKITFIMK